MALNFKILNYQNNNNLHLKLVGDFDGSSAFELIHALKERSPKVEKIIVHTDGLSSIHPFGLCVFQKNYPANRIDHNLSFSGKYRDIITPQPGYSV
jgi:hypothetical protein